MPYKEGSKWRAQVIQNGNKLTRVFLTKKEAIQWEVSIKHNEPCQPADQKTDTISLLEWTNQYLDFAKAKYVDKVYKEKVFVFRLFFENISPQKPAFFLTHKQVLDHLSKQASARSGYAANKDRKNLVAAWNWGIKYLGLPGMNPFLVDRFPEKRSPRHVPTERDFWAVYEQAESDQDRILLLAFLHLGARKKELFNLHRSDVDFAQSRIRLYTRKRRDGSLEFDWLPMTEHLFTALLGHLNSMENEWVFPNPETGIPYSDRNKWMHRLCGKGGVKPFGLHSIRHLTASILEKENIPLSHIQRILRHKKLTTTERYIHRLSSLRTSLTLLPIPKGTPEKTPLNPIKKEQGLRQVA